MARAGALVPLPSAVTLLGSGLKPLYLLRGVRHRPAWRLQQCSASVGQQHSHLEEAIRDMELSTGHAATVQEQAAWGSHHHTAPHSQQHAAPHMPPLAGHQHVFWVRPQPGLHATLQVPHIDGETVDAVEVLDWLRHTLFDAHQTAIVSADETGPAILDLISLLILLGEDAAQDDPGTVVLFQPIIDMRNKLAALQQQYSAAHNGGLHSHAHHRASAANGHAANGVAHNNGSGATQRHVFSDHNGSQHRPTSPSDMVPGLVAALITRARCPKLASHQPASCITATVHMDCSQIATAIAHAAQTQGSTRVRVVRSAQGLVAAWRALRRARAVVRARSGGTHDLLVTPHMTMEPAHATTGHTAEAVHAGDGHGSNQQQQQGVFFFNVWMR